MENTNAKKRKRLSPILLIFIILAALTAALVCAALIIWMSGRASLSGKETNAPMLVEVPTSAEPDENGGITAPTPAPTPSVPIDYDITSGGRYYKYKDELINLLFIGVDSNKKPKEPLKYGNDNQADVIILASLDTVNDKMSLIAVNRDTMCDMAILDKDGNTAGVGRAQIALSYSYGDGLNVSCELCREAVSALFYGLQIDGYAAFYMGGVADLNDALGGITVTIKGDYPFSNMPGCKNMKEGAEVTLTGKQAAAYIRSRQLTETGNAERMARQKQYLIAMIQTAWQKVAENPACVLNIYSSLSKYILSDLDVSELTYLATEAAGMSFSGDIYKLEGESIVSDEDHVELTLDKQSVFDTMIEVFYQDVTPQE